MSLRKNLLANAIGQGWGALVSLVFVPVYVRHLGMEGYGLVGVLAMLQAWFSLLDFGLGIAINREMARAHAGEHGRSAALRLVRQSVRFCAAVGAAVAVLVAWSSGWLASFWLQKTTLSAADVAGAVACMGVVVGCRLLEGIWQGVLLGLQRQVAVSATGAVVATLRWGGAAGLLAAGLVRVPGFFAWQAAVSLLSLAAHGVLATRALHLLPAPAVGGAPESPEGALRAMMHFGAGVWLTAVLAIFLTHLDKLLLSQLLSLEAFGHYTLAAVVAGAVQQLVQPIAQAFYPRFVQSLARDAVSAAREYHLAAQLAMVVAAPAALTLAAFPAEIVELWTGKATAAAEAAPLVRLLVLGALLNAVYAIPYTLQLAAGWSSFSARVNLVAAALCVPAMLVAAPVGGAIAMAVIWLSLNAAYVLVAAPWMHRWLLPAARARWLAGDVALPLLAALGLVLVARWFEPQGDGALRVAWFAGVGLLGTLAAFLASATLRPTVLAHRFGAMRASPP